MEKCLYDGKVLYAYQVLRDFEFEQKIRKCQTLTCCDCGASVFFRHGKQRAECFAHRHKEECRYGDYCKKQSDIFKFIQRQLAPIMEKIATKHGCSLPSKTQKSDTQNAKNRSDLSDLRKPERFFLCNIIF